MSTSDVVVVGGGIGGLSTAFALSRLGLRVRVLEQAEQFGEVGAGIQLAPNCTRILAEYGLLEQAAARGVVPDRMVMRDAVDAGELTALDLRDLERRYGFPYLVIHRSDLHALFLDACRDAVSNYSPSNGSPATRRTSRRPPLQRIPETFTRVRS